MCVNDLICGPHGIIEIDRQTQRPLQTYLYRNIKEVSLTSDEHNGLVLHIPRVSYESTTATSARTNTATTTATTTHCHHLSDIVSIIRHRPAPLSEDEDETSITRNEDEKSLTIEYRDGSSKMYSSANRDLLIVSLLDATVYMCRNPNVTVVDGSLRRYRLISLAQDEWEREVDNGDPAGALFHTDPLKLNVYNEFILLRVPQKNFFII